MILFRKAVLIIHGYAGGTYDQEELANHLEKNWNLDVYSFTLPGHEKRSKNTVKYEQWIKASEQQVEKLINYGYKKIYLVGHSMGGVIATYLANKYKDRVKKIVLVAPAFRYLVNEDDASIVNLLKKSKDMVRYNDKQEVLTRFLKLPISSLTQFRELVSNYKKYIKYIDIPILIIQGTEDTLVPKESSIELLDKVKSKKKELLLLEKTTHDVFRDKGKVKAIIRIEHFFKK